MLQARPQRHLLPQKSDSTVTKLIRLLSVRHCKNEPEFNEENDNVNPFS